MEQRLSQIQTQKMILSPQLRQYLRLLQLPVAELEQAIETELGENPLLEEVTQKNEETPLVPPEHTPTKELNTPEVTVGETYNEINNFEDAMPDKVENLDTSKRDPNEMQSIKNFQESLLTKQETLSDYLLHQARLQNFTEKEMAIAEEIIGNIDEDGYLQSSTADIAIVTQAMFQEVDEVLKRIQGFDPAGVGARNLPEALVLQLERKSVSQSLDLAIKMVRDHLPLLEKRDVYQISRVCGESEEAVKRALHIITELEPRPGRRFYAEEPVAITPDATVRYDDENSDKLVIDIHDESLPELRVNPYYRKLLREQGTDTKTRAFIREKMQSAVNFLKAIKLRKSTLREITEEIVKAQPEFFEKGFSHLKPMRLKDIAYSIGIHESTVSRALQGKYITTPQGVFPYRAFFSTKLEGLDGEDQSQKSIMEMIKNMIHKESSDNPLSDQTIVKLLGQEGIKVARRTVAKYRDLLRILPSHLRRKR